MEKDLKNILANLPQYEPPDAVWEGIAARLPLLELPTHDAPESVWETIETRLPLLELPTYDAPDLVWERIEQQLDNSEINAPYLIPQLSNLKILSGGKIWKIAAAASVALLIVAGFWFLKQQNTTQKDLQISSEVVDNQLIAPINDDDEAAFQQVEAFCQTAVVVCEKPEFKTLKTELDELNAAREELKTAIGDYNADADLVAELTKVEQERTVVLKNLVEMTMN